MNPIKNITVHQLDFNDELIAREQDGRYKEEQEERTRALNEALPASPELAEQLASGVELLKLAQLPPDAPKRFCSSLIDTVTVRLHMKHSPLDGYPKLRSAGRGYVAKSRFGTTATLFSSPMHDALTIEGSAPKFLTGQNIAGIEDMRGLCAEYVLKVLQSARINVNEGVRKMIDAGDYELMRADLAAHCDCLTPERAMALMIALRDSFVGTVGAFSTYGYFETLYADQHSGHRSLKVYQKGLEVKVAGHGIPMGVYSREFLLQRAAALVRFEVTMRRPGLATRHIDTVADWTRDTGRNLLNDYVDKIMNLGGISINVNGLERLTELTRTRLKLWLLGDRTAFDETKDTYRRHRKAVLDATGIDIRKSVTPKRQAETVATAKAIFEHGFGFRDRSEKWDLLKNPRTVI